MVRVERDISFHKYLLSHPFIFATLVVLMIYKYLDRSFIYGWTSFILQNLLFIEKR